MSHLPKKDTIFTGTEQLTNLTSLSGGSIDLDASTTVTVPTVAGTSDSTTKAASTAFVQAVAGTMASQAYVDSAVQGLDAKASVRVATTADGTLATAFDNGSTIDGVSISTGDRILIKDQSSALVNGIYVVQASGAPVRATDANTWAELVNAYVWVEEGTANADTAWVCSNNTGGTLETTAVTFVQFNSNSLTAGNGLTRTGNSFLIDTAITAALAGTQTFSGAKTFGAALLVNYATPVLEVRASSGTAYLEIDGASGSASIIQFKTGDTLRGYISVDSATTGFYGGTSGIYQLITCSSANNVVLGNSSGTLTSLATDPAITDDSTKVATTAWVQDAKRAGNITVVSNASFPYTVLASDDVIVLEQTAVSKAVTLLAANAVPEGWRVTIKDNSTSGAATYPVTINRAGSDTIDGLTSYLVDINKEAVELVSDGSSKWYLV